MLFGSIVKPNSDVTVDPTQGQLLHLSQACLGTTKGNAPTYLQMVLSEKTINICALAKDRCEHASFDLFFPTSDGVKFTVKGPNDIHISGYFEPDPETVDRDFDDEEEAEDSEIEEDLDEVPDADMLAGAQSIPGADKMARLMPAGAAKKGMKAAVSEKKKKAANSSDDEEDDDEFDQDELAAAIKRIQADAGDESEGDDDDDDDDDDDEDEDDDEDDDDDDDDEDDDEEDTPSPPVKPAQKGKAATPPKAGDKRKAASVPTAAVSEQPSNKRAKKGAPTAVAPKVAPGKIPASDDNGKYEASLKAHLHAHGRTSISSLGSSVKRPASVKKLGAFLKDRPSLFKSENGFVSLVA